MRATIIGTTAGTPIEIWFQDEARVGQKGGHAYIWAPRGSRPLMVRDNRHDSAYIFGAICPQRGVGAAIITPSANTEMMNLHLVEISTQVAPGARAVLICDGAGWHQKGQWLEIPENRGGRICLNTVSLSISGSSAGLVRSMPVSGPCARRA